MRSTLPLTPKSRQDPMKPPNVVRWKRVPAAALSEDISLSRDWDHLNTLGLDLPFLSSESIQAALHEFGCGREQLCVALLGETTVAMAVVVASDALRWTLFQPSQIPLGAWVSARETNLQGLAMSLLTNGLKPWAAALSITQVDPMLAPRTADSASTRHDDYINTAWLELTGSFEDYWSARGKNLRQNLRKQRSKLAEDGTVSSMLLWRDQDDMAAAIDRFGALESSGWKANGGTAVNRDNAQGRFYVRLLEACARRGESLVTEYRFGERTVAMNLGVLRNRTWSVLKTAYDESVGKTLSPSSLLREDELKRFFETRDVQRIEYFGRVMEWHTRLTENQRTLYHHTSYRWPWIRRLAERRRAATDTPAAAADVVKSE